MNPRSMAKSDEIDGKVTNEAELKLSVLASVTALRIDEV